MYAPKSVDDLSLLVEHSIFKKNIIFLNEKWGWNVFHYFPFINGFEYLGFCSLHTYSSYLTQWRFSRPDSRNEDCPRKGALVAETKVGWDKKQC